MNCTNHIDLRMGDNNLAGDISLFDFSNLSQLTKLDLRKNNFSGTLPLSLYSCKLLKAIRLSENNLEGEIQPEILSLKSLSFLSVGTNRLTNITKALQILVHCRSLVFLSFKSSFIAQEDDTELELPLYLSQSATFLQYKLSYVPPAIYINNNTISGNIPIEIGQLQLLHELGLHNNKFSGKIPEQISNLKNLEVLDISTNHLSGKIPSSLASLNFLKYFNVSNNNLEGQIPISTQSKASMLLHSRGIQNFVVPHFQMSACLLMAVIQIIRISKIMWTMGIKFHSLIFLLLLGSL
ncbi:putative non-specific serine/threonine protein kinase [Rosa chinensis]|uniref:Putative non-specific serine/threonine protein kinase n=1 Tax=Rosa chinensis TaxID=74649 RepID=A0A2P6QT22_ROSCH|nr:putative non-specific serine/threonine protein kinase [Rosa chinensis]